MAQIHRWRACLVLGALLSLPLAGRPAQAQAPQPQVAGGRITGTVIDLTSGAPAARIEVDVGEARVITDANGNYDRQGLAPGNYSVALALAAEQGAPAQAPISVALAEGQTVVQHLAFRSQAVAAPAPAIPAQLPNTGAPAPSRAWLAGLGCLLLVAGLALARQRLA